MDQKAEQIRLTPIVRETLLHELDPIGISGIPGTADEYHAYAAIVVNMMLTQDASAKDIFRYLYKVVRRRMI